MKYERTAEAQREEKAIAFPPEECDRTTDFLFVLDDVFLVTQENS